MDKAADTGDPDWALVGAAAFSADRGLDSFASRALLILLAVTAWGSPEMGVTAGSSSLCMAGRSNTQGQCIDPADSFPRHTRSVNEESLHGACQRRA